VGFSERNEEFKLWNITSLSFPLFSASLLLKIVKEMIIFFSSTSYGTLNAIISLITSNSDVETYLKLHIHNYANFYSWFEFVSIDLKPNSILKFILWSGLRVN
jgi:hypothetical protein